MLVIKITHVLANYWLIEMSFRCYTQTSSWRRHYNGVEDSFLSCFVNIVYSCLRNSISQLPSVTCHVGSHRVTFYPIQVRTPSLNLSQTSRYSIYPPRRDRRLSWPRWLVTYRDGLPARRRPHPSTNRPNCRLTKLFKANALTTALSHHL